MPVAIKQVGLRLDTPCHDFFLRRYNARTDTMNRLMRLKPFRGCPANHKAPIPLGMPSHARYLPSMLNSGAKEIVIAYR